MSNQKLFMYGLYSGLIQLTGIIILSCSWLPLLRFDSWFLSIVVFIIGIVIIIKGKAMRFDYKRRSGSIIHRGDW